MHHGARRRVSLGLSALLLLSLEAPAIASTAVSQWQRFFRPSADGTTSAAPIAARELADGTILVVTDAVNAVHYDADGNVLGSQRLSMGRVTHRSRTGDAKSSPQSPGFGDSHAVIDAFGGVTVAIVDERDYVLEGAGDVETAKFDGLTGQPLWASPVRYHSGIAMIPNGIFLDSAGNVIVKALALQNLFDATLKYDGRTGALLWGPALIQNLSTTLGRPSTSSVDTQGNVFVSYANGITDGISTLKYSGADGSILWGPVDFHDDQQRSNGPRSSLSRADGSLVVAGFSGPDFLTLAYDGMSGALLWGPSVFTPADAFINDTTDPSALTADASGNVFVSGTYRNQARTNSMITFKLAGGTGALLWSGSPIPAPGFPSTLQNLPLANGDVAVGGGLGSPDSNLEFWRYRGEDGALLWGPTAFEPFSVYYPVDFVASNGRIFAAAYGSVLNSGEWDAGSGAPIWGPTPFEYPFVGLGYFEDLGAGPDGNPVVVGDAISTTTAIAILKYSRATGDVLWGPVLYDASAWQRGWQVQVDGNNDVILVAYYQDDSDTGEMLLKFSGASGALIWGPQKFSNVTPWRIALDPAGNVFALSYQPAPISGYESLLTKISGANGSTLWGPVVYIGDTYAFPHAIAIDSAGDAYVIGDADVGVFDRWFVLKYSGANGSVLWGPHADVDWQPYGVAVGANGVAVTGYGAQGMTTVKYAADSGSLIWGPMVAPGSQQGDQGETVAIASNGDVVVSGEALHVDTASDWSTLRYAAADGQVVWGPVFVDGDAHGYDLVYTLGLAFDASGNVVLGGTIRTAARLNDVGLVKYAWADGAVLWGPILAGGVENEHMSGFDVRGNSIVVGSMSDAAMRTEAFDESLGISTPGPLLAPAFCGESYDFAFVAQNGSPAYTWSVAAGALPSGLSLSSGGSLAGTPTEQGTFSFTVRVTDSTLAHADRAFTLVVTEDPTGMAILAFPGPSCHYTLAVTTGTWTSYLWLPSGETTSTIDVSPIETTTYGVELGDGSGCLLHLSITIPGTALQDPACLAPSVKSIAPSSGPASGGTSVTIAGGNFQPGVQLEIGGQIASSAFVDPSHLTATTPALAPGTLNTVVVQNPDTGNAALLNAFFADFLDVPSSDLFHDSIERLFRRGVTAGCDVGLYCPDANTTRAQMAVFLLKSLLGAGYVPPQQTGGVFADVPFEAFAAAWIEDLYARGITGGCLLDPLRYCPDANVSRAEMAVFLLKTLLGKDYVPPPATGTIFADVAADAFAAAWIEDLYHRGITAGCLTGPLRYCPDASVTRAEMAAFLVLTFSL